MTTSSDDHSPEQWGGRLTPSDVHHVLFNRAGFGRRGYDEVEVDVFLERVEQELTSIIDERTDLRAEVSRLKAQLASVGPGSRVASSVASTSEEEAQLQAVRLLAAAQQTADTYVADAEEYSRRLTREAREHSEQMVAEARQAAQRMVAEAERLAGATAASTVDGEVVATPGLSKEELDQHVAYLTTFGQVVRVQLRAYLEALLRDVEEWDRVDPGVGLATPPAVQKKAEPVPDDASPPATDEEEPDGAPPPVTDEEEPDGAPPPATDEEEPDGAPPPATDEGDPGGAGTDPEEAGDATDPVEQETTTNASRARSRKRTTIRLHSH
jgi:DivIVA domain-containing protein